jgi:hypothetical protein
VRFLHRVEVGPLHVLYDGYDQLVTLGHLADDRRNMIQAGDLSRANAPFSGYELVAVKNLRDQDRLEHAVNRDASRELLKGVLLNPLTRLIGVAADARNRDLDWRRAGGAGLRDQGAEASSEAGMALRV